MLQDLTHDVVFLPANDEQLSLLVGRLRNELNEHFSFAPKSTNRLEEVLLGTFGMPNGRQQWQALRNRPIIDDNLKNGIRTALTDRRVSPELQALMNHEDRQVRAMAQSILALGEEALVTMFSYADLEGLEYGAHLTPEEAKACFRYAQRHLDADQGINWDALDDAAQAIFHQRVFHPYDPKAGKPQGPGIRYLDWNYPDRGDRVVGWYDPEGRKYELYLPEEGEDDDEPLLIGPDSDDKVPGEWQVLAS